MRTHKKYSSPPPVPWPRLFPGSVSSPHRGECFCTGLAQGVVVERAGAAQWCTPVVQGSCRRVISASPEGLFLLGLYHCHGTKRMGPGTLIQAFCISPAASVTAISSFFVGCQVQDRHQCENMTARK